MFEMMADGSDKINNTDELVRELGIAVSGDLLDGEGGRLTPAEGVETPWAGIEAYVGTWEYLDWEGALLELRYDDTWTLYLNGEILQEGTWAIYNGYAYTYDDEGAYNTTLTPDVGGLIADGEYLVPSAGADYDEEADAAAWAEIASLDGYWYENGDFDAEEYLSIINGEWSFQSFSSGEPEELAAGTIVPSAGEPHAFYARSGESDEAFYFRYSPAEENDTGSDLIYWDNDAFLFMRLE